jgi:predicted nuclease of restriction endonuclease-like (RecB) superfamily
VVAERDLEQALMDRIADTLPEMDPGLSFVGRAVHFDVGGDDFHIINSSSTSTNIDTT